MHGGGDRRGWCGRTDQVHGGEGVRRASLPGIVSSSGWSQSQARISYPGFMGRRRSSVLVEAEHGLHPPLRHIPTREEIRIQISRLGEIKSTARWGTFGHTAESSALLTRERWSMLSDDLFEALCRWCDEWSDLALLGIKRQITIERYREWSIGALKRGRSLAVDLQAALGDSVDVLFSDWIADAYEWVLPPWRD